MLLSTVKHLPSRVGKMLSALPLLGLDNLFRIPAGEGRSQKEKSQAEGSAHRRSLAFSVFAVPQLNVTQLAAFVRGPS